jgi:preprotein translocase, SecE subunit, bacterial
MHARIILHLPRAARKSLASSRHRQSLGPSGDLVPGGADPYLKAAGEDAGLSRRNRAIMAEQKNVAEEKKRKTSVAEFVSQVRTETGKIVWPTREETVRTAIFVFIFMLILSLFFLGIDSVFGALVRAAIGLLQ